MGRAESRTDSTPGASDPSRNSVGVERGPWRGEGGRRREGWCDWWDLWSAPPTEAGWTSLSGRGMAEQAGRRGAMTGLLDSYFWRGACHTSLTGRAWRREALGFLAVEGGTRNGPCGFLASGGTQGQERQGRGWEGKGRGRGRHPYPPRGLFQRKGSMDKSTARRERLRGAGARGPWRSILQVLGGCLVRFGRATSIAAMLFNSFWLCAVFFFFSFFCSL